MVVHHAVDESEDAVDLKKSIAAAFQANFKGTEHEEEEDPQSDHTLLIQVITITHRQAMCLQHAVYC